MKTEIEVLVCDITKMSVEAIVNSANSSLRPGSGLSGLIHKVAGSELYEECKNYGTLEPGQAIITKGYNLPNKYVINTVTPKWYLNSSTRVYDLKSCYSKSIKLAKENNIKEIAFPCIGMGIYACPLEIGGKIAVETVKEEINKDDLIKKIYFVCGSKEQAEIYKALL